MKKTKMIYWTSTAIISLMMIFSAYYYIANPTIKEAFLHLGYPDYFRVELAVAKMIGAILLIIPFVSRFKEWVYAGFAFTFISAFISHISSGDAMQMSIAPLIFLIPLGLSYFTWHKLQSSRRLALSNVNQG
ncbi:MAG: DoxX family protein [Chitinophagaceae bacterium]|nr:DoxX family protein [Chitinophagaceae bacterium]